MLLALGGCDEPRSEAYSPERESHFTPVTIALELAELAQKIDGIATLVSPESLAQLNADIRAAEIAANFSQRAVQRYKETKRSRALGRQRRAAGLDGRDTSRASETQVAQYLGR